MGSIKFGWKFMHKSFVNCVLALKKACGYFKLKFNLYKLVKI